MLAAISSSLTSQASASQTTDSYFKQRTADLKHLGQAIQSGNLSAAQQDYQNIQTLAQSGPFSNGNAFKVTQRQQDFNAIGQALQQGDLTSAQQAFTALKNTLAPAQSASREPAVVVTLTGALSGSAPSGSTGTTPSSGPEVVLNLDTVTPGEQITIGINDSSSGGEQVTIGVASQQNQSPEQVTLNLNQNSNAQIVLNFLTGSASSSTGSSAGSGINVSA